TAPEFAHEDPLVGPWLVHARADARLGDSVLWHDSIDFTGDRRGRVQAMLGMAGVLRSGAANPRFAYMPINPANTDALTFARAGAQPAGQRRRPRGAGRVRSDAAARCRRARLRRQREREAAPARPDPRLLGARTEPRAGRDRLVAQPRCVLRAVARGGRAGG